MMAAGLWTERQEELYLLEVLGRLDEVYAALNPDRPPACRRAGRLRSA
jgi:hypothetical protein